MIIDKTWKRQNALLTIDLSTAQNNSNQIKGAIIIDKAKKRPKTFDTRVPTIFIMSR